MQDYREAEAEIVSALALPGSADVEIRTELKLLEAFVLCQTGRSDQARPILAKLIERPAIPPHMHARVLMFALIFRLREASDDFLEDLRETMGQILEEIRSGAFAEEFIGDIKAGGPRMKALRDQAKGSQIEAVGKELRGMMPFVSGGKQK